MKNIMFVFGTRPEFIKVYPVIMEAKRQGNPVIIVNTGQHKEMVNELLTFFKLDIDYDLKIMDKCNGLSDIESIAISGIDKIIKHEMPDVVLVHGDTASTLAGALAAFNNQIKIGHIEAGLRTYNMQSPYPEESNRQMVGLIANYHFAPTRDSEQNLLLEGKNADDVFVVGNSAIDMLKYTIRNNYSHPILDWQPEKKLILMTAHRRENLEDLDHMFKAIYHLADKYNDDYKIVYPIHMNPLIRAKADKYLNHPNIMITEPLETVTFHNIMRHSHLILTDSGGIQEEAPSLGIPVLVLRDTTERPEGVEAGTLKLVGTNYDAIITETELLLDNQEVYDKMQGAVNPYGEGFTSNLIINILNGLGDYNEN